jgi:hypothetical protein
VSWDIKSLAQSLVCKVFTAVRLLTAGGNYSILVSTKNNNKKETPMKRIIFAASMLLLALTQSALAETRMGIYYQINVNDPAAVVAALEKYRNSSTGKKSTAVVTLSQMLSNGTNPATHSLSVSYASSAEMDAARALNQGSKDWATLQGAMRKSATQVSQTMFRLTNITAGSSDVITSANPVTRFILMNVEDPASYAAAWTKMMSSRESNLPSNVFQTMGNGTAATTHGVAISANNMAEMTALFEENQNNPAWAEFLRSVKDIRTVEDDSFVIQLKSWGS